MGRTEKCGLGSAQAANISIAVAANFTDPAKEIAVAFKRKTGLRALLSIGASRQFYSQITLAAPFQVLLSAEGSSPEGNCSRMVSRFSESRFTYAMGTPVLCRTTANRERAEMLKSQHPSSH
ncbi:substrate-binding domain-containing protein [Bradyrhizobium valentinum]|uniref:substrate-binding domain-containing protein n=1 Tax=Bradyrhizobium valentinum TaxID=1518501 RepID=UPI0030B83372